MKDVKVKPCALDSILFSQIGSSCPLSGASIAQVDPVGGVSTSMHHGATRHHPSLRHHACHHHPSIGHRQTPTNGLVGRHDAIATVHNVDAT